MTPTLITKVTAAEPLLYPSHGEKHLCNIISFNLHNSPMRYYFHVKDEAIGTERVSNRPKPTHCSGL